MRLDGSGQNTKKATVKAKLKRQVVVESDVELLTEHDDDDNGVEINSNPAPIAPAVSRLRRGLKPEDLDKIHEKTGLTNRKLEEITRIGKMFGAMYEMYMPAPSASFWLQAPPISGSDQNLPLRTGGSQGDLDRCRLVSLYSVVPPTMQSMIRTHPGFPIAVSTFQLRCVFC